MHIGFSYPRQKSGTHNPKLPSFILSVKAWKQLGIWVHGNGNSFLFLFFGAVVEKVWRPPTAAPMSGGWGRGDLPGGFSVYFQHCPFTCALQVSKFPFNIYHIYIYFFLLKTLKVGFLSYRLAQIEIRREWEEELRKAREVKQV